MRKFDLNKICRICLCEKIKSRVLIETKIPNMLRSLSSIQITAEDGLPNTICWTCHRYITKLYAFKRKVEKNDLILRQYFKNLHTPCKTDILNIALCKADINPNNDEKRENEELFDKDILLDTGESEKHEIQLQELCVADSNLDVKIFTSCPPPLIPLKPTRKCETSDSFKVRSEDLPDDTPPLIPIKPLINANIDVLENIMPTMDVKYQCNNCTEEFESILSLKQHKLSICRLNLLQCNVCRKEFKESKKLIGHLKGHMVSKDYICKICSKRYPNPSSFTVHMRSHTGERPFKCHICNKGFVRMAGVIGHMRTHQEAKPFKCSTCGKAFKVASNLERHKILHSGILPYCCSWCGKCFSQSDNLQLHIRTYHTNERPYLCSVCGKGFVNSTRLNRHMWVHSGYKPYSCNDCSKSYTNLNDLRNHQRQHVDGESAEFKNYSCNVCNMKFYHPCRLAKHLKIHERSYQCGVCDKCFGNAAVLKRHVDVSHRTSRNGLENENGSEEKNNHTYGFHVF